MPVAASGESESVFAAARFGWNLAMLRGRLRDGAPAEQAAPIHRTDNALPLGVERSWKEQTIQVEAVVRGLAQASSLDVDVDLTELSYQGEDAKGSATGRLEDLTKALARARENGKAADIEGAWSAVAVFLASWDAKIQDRLAHRALVSAGYQLGRGLAEIRWAMVPNVDAVDDVRALRHLAGPARVAALRRLVDRLATTYDAVTREALTSSLDSWAALMASEAHVDDELVQRLDRQALVWHDLAVGERSGSDLVDLGQLLSEPALLRHVLGQLKLELAGSAIAIIVLSIGAWFLGSSQVAQHPPAAVATVLGIVGVTVSAISARARSAAKGLSTALREKVFADLVAKKAFVGPSTAGKG